MKHGEDRAKDTVETELNSRNIRMDNSKREKKREDKLEKKRGKTRGRIILGILVGAVLLMVIGTSIYLNDYYHADSEAMECLESMQVTIVEVEDKRIDFIPENPTVGLIFYPGGKVEYEAYAPLLDKLSGRGVLCVLLHMPGNLAILDGDAAKGIQEDYPEIQSWYLAGHSLGGVMAASFAEKHAEDFAGLILLAAYSTADLSETDLNVLSIYGSEDGVMNRESYEKYRENLPSGMTESVISGGCHAGFGNYGAQEGDGEPSISAEEQQEETVAEILKLMELN